MELSTSKMYEILTILLLSAIMPHVEASAQQQQLTVKGYGVSPVKPGDTALVFYASVSHNGSSGDNPVVARLEMERCCLDEGKTQNCNVVKLVSGLAFIFHPHNSHNLWMFHLNYDLKNREGSCIVHLITKDYTGGGHSDTEQSWTKGPPIKFPFKTQLQNPPGPHGEDKRVCSSDNYDALRGCPHMDNCLIRNSGMKSLVNPQTGVCTAAPTCQDSSKQFLSLATQKCQNIHDVVLIHDSFTYEMTHATGLSNSVVEQSNHFQSMLQRANLSEGSKLVRISCGHGHFVANPNGHGNCTCDPGWRSVTVDEWRKNGGIMNDEDDASIPRFCTVPLRQRKQLNFLMYAAIGISLIVIFALTICYNLRMTKPSRSRENLKLLKDTHNSPSSSGESSSEENSYDEESKLVSAKPKSSKSLENVEADEIISEVTNRREPTVSKKSSKADGNNRNDDDDGGNPTGLPPAGPPSSNKREQPSDKPPSSKASRPSSSKPPPKSKTKSEGHHSAMLSDYFVDPFDPNPSRNLRSINFGGFASSEADDEENNVYLKTAEKRIAPLMDNTIKIFARSSPSTDELLDLKPQEKLVAHVPMQPSSSVESYPSIVASNTKEESAARSRRVSFSAMRDPPTSPGQDGELVRIRTIYGDSDVDSDAALEELVKDSVPVTIGCSLHQTTHLEQSPSPNLGSRAINQNNWMRGMNPEQLPSDRIASETFSIAEGHQKQEPKGLWELIGPTGGNNLVTLKPQCQLKQPQKKTTKPPPKSKTKSEGQHSAMLSDYFVDPFDPNPSRNLRSINFGGFASSEGDEEEKNIYLKTAEKRIAPVMDNTIKILARTSPSTDELLDLKPQEKSLAHVRMQPSTSVESYPSSVASNGSLVELVENDINVNRLSSEELTCLRKDQGAEFLATLDESSEYALKLCDSQTQMQRSFNDEVDSEWEDSNSFGGPPQDFYYFNRNHKPKAAKVPSVPIMMQYHPCQLQNAGLQQKFDDDFYASRFAEGSAECYQTLSNISPAALSTSTEKSVSRTQSSIWSNVASENTQKESASRECNIYKV